MSLFTMIAFPCLFQSISESINKYLLPVVADGNFYWQQKGSLCVFSVMYGGHCLKHKEAFGVIITPEDE